MIDCVLKDLPFANAFLEDVVVFCETISEHLVHLEGCFLLVANQKLWLKFPRCEYELMHVCLSGHVVSAIEIQMNSENAKAMRKAPVQLRTTSLRSFLELAGCN